MLKHISKIKGLGVYHNYIKPSDTQDFGIKNLIYGWNYSGKTTLSRLFSQLETKTYNPDLSGCEFTFVTDKETITEKNFTTSNLSVRVFNSDFVKNNLHFEGGNFNPILLLGKDSDEAQKRIDLLTGKIARSNTAQKKLLKKAENLKKRIAESKTETAKFIRQRLKIDPYTAPHLEKDIVAVSLLDFQLFSEDTLSEKIELALTPDSNRPSSVDTIQLTPKLQSIHDDAKAILSSIPNFSNTIKHLEDNPQIEKWVQSGLHIHPIAGKCEFCGNQLGQIHLDSLRAHFSKDLTDHKDNIEALLTKAKTSELTLVSPKARELNSQYRTSYSEAIKTLTKAISEFNQSARTLINEIQLKVEDPHKPVIPTPIKQEIEQCVLDAVAAANLIICQNNQLAAHFDKAKSEALREARYYYVKQFVDEQESGDLEIVKNRQNTRVERLKLLDVQFQAEVDKLQAEISRAQQGREKINKRLVMMLGNEAVQIKVIKDALNQERFQLVRKNGIVAKNLSDGERTAIAFSYFLTKLQELAPEDFKDTIVYIDDPISSLDANHIFQITAAIRSIFFKQKDKNSPWETTCKQLFVSTHNFEFFNLLREIKPNTAGKGAMLFIIKKIAENISTFENMPSSLVRYQSEYQFLFEVIHRFHKAPDKTDHEVLMLLPNAMRRFIELYTYSRLPGPKDSEQVDDRAEVLFGVERAKRILKVFHYFSHGNTLDRLIGNNELIFDMEHAVKDMIEAISEHDRPHLDALMTAISTN